MSSDQAGKWAQSAASGGNIQAHDVGFRDRARRLPILPLEDADRVVSVATAQPEVVAAAKRIATGGIVSSLTDDGDYMETGNLIAGPLKLHSELEQLLKQHL